MSPTCYKNAPACDSGLKPKQLNSNIEIKILENTAGQSWNLISIQLLRTESVLESSFQRDN